MTAQHRRRRRAWRRDHPPRREPRRETPEPEPDVIPALVMRGIFDVFERISW